MSLCKLACVSSGSVDTTGAAGGWMLRNHVFDAQSPAHQVVAYVAD